MHCAIGSLYNKEITATHPLNFALYLCIFIALIEVHTNQKRFQCERPIEKRAVFRERKEALDTQVNMVDHVEGGSWFQSARPVIANARL